MKRFGLFLCLKGEQKMSEKIIATEEMRLEKEWFKEAREQTFETLPNFIKHVMDDYEHSYGTVCHAISACAIAAAWAADRMEGACGGITGFQSGFVMWDFIRQWQYTDNKTGLSIVNWDNMLFPQYEHIFDKEISKSIWENIQEQAKENLKNAPDAAESVVEHWKSIADGKVPFGYRTIDK